MQSLQDRDDWAEKVREMNVPLTEKQIKMYNDRRAYLNSYLNDIQLQVNNNQYGCAVAATC